MQKRTLFCAMLCLESARWVHGCDMLNVDVYLPSCVGVLVGILKTNWPRFYANFYKSLRFVYVLRVKHVVIITTSRLVPV